MYGTLVSVITPGKEVREGRVVNPDEFSNALSALYPKRIEQKRLLAAMLLAVPRWGRLCEIDSTWTRQSGALLAIRGCAIVWRYSTTAGWAWEGFVCWPHVRGCP